MAKRKQKPSKQKKELSRLELQVMDVVWELGDCSSAEVIAEFCKKRPLAETTIRTVLTNLRKKGYLEPIPTVERGYRLRATVARESVAGRWMSNLVDNLFGNSPREAICHLLKDENITDEDLNEIGRLIQNRKRRRKGK